MNRLVISVDELFKGSFAGPPTPWRNEEQRDGKESIVDISDEKWVRVGIIGEHSLDVLDISSANRH